MTTVRELIQDLLLLDSDLEVYVGSTDLDASPVYRVDQAEDTYVDEGGMCWPYDPVEESPNAVVIWPV